MAMSLDVFLIANLLGDTSGSWR